VPDEEIFIKRAQQGDQEAFARLYEENFDKIYRYLSLRVGDRMEAEDMTQQVFLKALQSITSFKWRGVPFTAWLYRIARNQVIDHQRKKGKRQPDVPIDESLASNADDPQAIAEQNLDIERVLLATRQLTEAQREVISLRFTSELPIAEVAGIMGKSQGAIKALQHSAIAALRRILTVADNVENVENNVSHNKI